MILFKRSTNCLYAVHILEGANSAISRRIFMFDPGNECQGCTRSISVVWSNRKFHFMEYLVANGNTPGGSQRHSTARQRSGTSTWSSAWGWQLTARDHPLQPSDFRPTGISNSADACSFRPEFDTLIYLATPGQSWHCVRKPLTCIGGDSAAYFLLVLLASVMYSV